MDKLNDALKRTGIACKTVNDDGKEMIEQLKDKFQSATHKGRPLNSHDQLHKSHDQWSLVAIYHAFVFCDVPGS